MMLAHSSCNNNLRRLSQLACKSARCALVMLAMKQLIPPIIPAVHHHRSHVWGSGCRGSPHEGEHGQSVLRHTHVRPLSVMILNNHPLVLPPFGVPFLTLRAKCVQREGLGKWSKERYSILLVCSAEKVLDSNRRNLVQLCLLLGGDRVQEKNTCGNK